MKTLVVVDRGRENYQATLAYQQSCVDLVFAEREDRLGVDGKGQDFLITVEHEHVYTTGRGVPAQAVREQEAREVPWVEVSRGGQATYHGPGQVVVYPILDLQLHGSDVHLYLRKLEETVIRALDNFGIQAESRPGFTGVWVKKPLVEGSSQWFKVASIGVGIRRWVSYHGIAVNVSPNLNYFRSISPCGGLGSEITSVAELKVAQGLPVPTVFEVKEALISSFMDGFGYCRERREVSHNPRRRPDWLKVKAGGAPGFNDTEKVVRAHGLVTVCEEAHCPNIGECWSHGTATFMIMGELCTRRCSFCSVKDGTLDNLAELNPLEPVSVAQAVLRLGLRHVVVTSVDRDDLPDMGAEHFYRTIQAIKQVVPACKIEILIPDMRGKRNLLEQILRGQGVTILNHNVETVPRLYKTVRPGAQLKRSLDILRYAKEIAPEIKTKSGLMVGFGESSAEVCEVLEALRQAQVDIVTIGQYLQPTGGQLPVVEYVNPRRFAEYSALAKEMGFIHVESGPLVRSSYHAWKHSSDSTTEGLVNLPGERPGSSPSRDVLLTKQAVHNMGA